MLDDNRDAFPWLRELRPSDLAELLCWFMGGTICFDHIAHLLGLHVLEITDATVAGGIDLHRYPSLKTLTLYRTGVGEDRIASLRRDFPRVHIDWQA